VRNALAVGVSGEDLILAKVRDPRLGFVGDVASIDATILHELLTEGLIPVVAPLGKDDTGQTYNINADTVAGAIAVALGASTLIYLTDVEGLRRTVSDESSLIRHTTATELTAMLADGTIANGMIPKVQGCIDALRSGVREVHILDGRTAHVLLDALTDKEVGTVVR
jgi:acetylglutamate kinase